MTWPTGRTCPRPRATVNSRASSSPAVRGQLTGVFFTPEAQPFKLAGGGNWGQQQAQFIAYDLTVTGGSLLQMAPKATFPKPPADKGYLVR